jgi:hypothetical protein
MFCGHRHDGILLNPGIEQAHVRLRQTAYLHIRNTSLADHRVQRVRRELRLRSCFLDCYEATGQGVTLLLHKAGPPVPTLGRRSVHSARPANRCLCRGLRAHSDSRSAESANRR